MEPFDESEVREIGIDDRNYPELLKRIRKPPKAIRYRGNLPPNRKMRFLGAEKRHSKPSIPHIESAGCSRNTDIQSSMDLPMVAILL